MIRETLNKDWIFVSHPTISVQSLAHSDVLSGVLVDLPHDAMIHEPRSENASSKNQSGFYTGGTYCYIKRLFVPMSWKNEKLTLEFEGVYKNSSVYINGNYAGGCHNGYTEFLVQTDGFLRYDEENEIKVMVNNLAQPSSRWYTGSGIYRNVNLLRSSRVYLSSDGVRFKTTSANESLAALFARIKLVNENPQPVQLRMISEISDEKGAIVSCDELPLTIFGNSEELLLRHMQIHHPKLWDCENPSLYHYRVRLVGDDREVDREEGRIGVRTLVMDGLRGLLINDIPTKLRGTCIHHDNGILGACAFAQAEARRVSVLKEAGFNCIRSTHNPISRAMLDACDEQGMLVMDEYADIWTLPKNAFDDAQFFADDWRKDIRSLVRKDYNHPSVILYCLGNEIPEAGNEHGAALCRKMDTFLKEQDDSRFTANGTNALLACSSRLKEVVGDLLEGRELAPRKAQDGDMDDVSAVNSFAGLIHGPLGDAMLTHPIITEMLAPFNCATDITGLNYMPSRYALEHELYPDKLVLGTEEYPGDIVRLWSLVKQHPHVIGDMTWTGYDYIGEAGIGIFYYDGTANFMPHWPDRLANVGDIDILGNRRPISYLREIVYGLRKAPYIAVMRMNYSGQKAGQTPWMFKDNIASWTWHGYDGQEAFVDVYCDAEQVELLLNGQSLGIQAAGEGHQFTATFAVPYSCGILTARAIRGGVAMEECSLETADEQVEIAASIEDGGGELLYIPVHLTDAQGRRNVQASKTIRLSAANGAEIVAFGTANPSTTEAFDDLTWTTYDGAALAVVRTPNENNGAMIIFSADGCKDITLKLNRMGEHP